MVLQEQERGETNVHHRHDLPSNQMKTAMGLPSKPSIQSIDDDAVKRLFTNLFTTRRQGILFGYLINHGSSKEDAEDAVQATYIRVLHALRGSRGPREGSRPTKWLFLLLRNVMVDTFRREQRQPRVSESETLRLLTETIPDPDDHPSGKVLTKERAQELWRFVARHLSYEDRNMVHMSLSGLNSKEIAVILNMTNGQVRTRLSRALATLGRHKHELS